MFDYDLFKVFYPFIILFFLAVFYALYFYKIKLITSKYFDVIKQFSGKHEKKYPIKLIIPEISVVNRYCNGESDFDHLFSWRLSENNCFLGIVSSHVISGWSFYSTILVIEKTYTKNNIVVSGEDLNSAYKFVRELKKRGANFYVYSSDRSKLNWLNSEELKLLDDIFILNKRSMLDFYDGKLVITMGGSIRSCLIEPHQLCKLIEKLQEILSKRR